MKLTAVLEPTGKNTTAFVIPEPVVDELAGGRSPKVSVTVDGYTFRTSVARRGERYLLGVSAERRAAAGLSAGQMVEIDLVLDTAPRDVDVPEDLARALRRDADASAAWAKLAYSRRQWHVLNITAAKKDQTRQERINRCVDSLTISGLEP